MKTSVDVPLFPCTADSGFPMTTDRFTVSMMCFKELPEVTRTLVGDFYAERFSYFKMTLNYCANTSTNLKSSTCATQIQVADFFASNPKLMFYYKDSYIDIDDYKFLIQDYMNTNNYVSVDLNKAT